MIKIPVYRPCLRGNERQYVNECLDSTWISSKGRFIAEFETRFAGYLGVEHAETVSNGTVALHLALVALGIGPGMEVIVPTLTYIASVNAIAYTRASPVFVDSLPGTWQMDPDDVRRKITPRTRALLVVHLYGHPCEMSELSAIAREHDLFLIEDCAESFGSRYQGRHTGTFGDVAAFSFFGNKTITTGEGGMVVTNNETLAERLHHFKGQGLAKYREYWHDVIGYNYRMTNLSAAIGLAQLEQADGFLARKRQLAAWYREELADAGVVFHEPHGNVLHTHWMCSILVAKAADRDPLRAELAAAGIETRPLFHPVHTMPMYSECFRKYPVAETLSRRGINLPSYPELTRDEVGEITAVICRGKWRQKTLAAAAGGGTRNSLV
jgi:perosamine synthetase